MRTQEAPFLIAATLLHLAIPLAARWVPKAEPVLVARSSGAYGEIEVEVQPVAPLPPEDAPRAAARVPENERALESDPQRSPRTPRAVSEPGPTPSPEVPPAPLTSGAPSVEPVTPQAPSSNEYGGPPSPEGVAVAPGLGGTPVWQLPGVLPDRAPSHAAPAPTVAPAPRATPIDKAGELIREAMRTKDKTLGLDLPAAGTVATVVADAVRASNTPETARAIFEVSLSGAGRVIGLRVMSSNAGATEDWGRVARAALTRLADRTLTMPSAFAKGAKIYVSVVSAVRMPSGADSGGVHPGGMGFDFDVSDIGARPLRVVSSTFYVVAVE